MNNRVRSRPVHPLFTYDPHEIDRNRPAMAPHILDNGSKEKSEWERATAAPTPDELGPNVEREEKNTT